MAEYLAVNQGVVGSSPSCGAIFKKALASAGVFLFFAKIVVN